MTVLASVSNACLCESRGPFCSSASACIVLCEIESYRSRLPRRAGGLLPSSLQRVALMVSTLSFRHVSVLIRKKNGLGKTWNTSTRYYSRSETPSLPSKRKRKGKLLLRPRHHTYHNHKHQTHMMGDTLPDDAPSSSLPPQEETTQSSSAVGSLKSWERSWTLAELRTEPASSLAADAGVPCPFSMFVDCI